MPPSQFDILTQLAPARKQPDDDSYRRAITIGIICTILFHVFLFCVAPLLPIEKFGGDHANLAAIAARKNKSFDFQLEPMPQPPPKPDPFKFVETNPDAPANEPDKTNNFSNRNQQSAQAEAAKEKDPENRPSVKGRDDIKDSNAVVSGDHAQPQQGAAATPNSSKTPDDKSQQSQPARAEQIPLNGFENKEGKSEDGVGSSVSHNPAPSNHAPQLVEGARDAKGTDGGLLASNQVTHAQPKPRPRLSAVRSTVLANRVAGTMNVGIVGQDARWSEYGDYLSELVEIVDAEWHSIVDPTNIHVKPGTHVTVTFRLNPKGEVTVQSIEKDPPDSDQVVMSQCTSGITNRAPYRKWTDQMVAVLGGEQTLVFAFYYY